MPESVLKEGRVVERNEGEDSQRGYYGGDVQERGRTLGRRSRTGAGKESRNCPRVLFVRPQAGPQTPAGRGCGLNLPSNTHPARFSSVFAYYSALVGFLPSPSARLHAPPRALRRRGMRSGKSSPLGVHSCPIGTAGDGSTEAATRTMFLIEGPSATIAEGKPFYFRKCPPRRRSSLRDGGLA